MYSLIWTCHSDQTLEIQGVSFIIWNEAPPIVTLGDTELQITGFDNCNDLSVRGQNAKAYDFVLSFTQTQTKLISSYNFGSHAKKLSIICCVVVRLFTYSYHSSLVETYKSWILRSLGHTLTLPIPQRALKVFLVLLLGKWHSFRSTFSLEYLFPVCFFSTFQSPNKQQNSETYNSRNPVFSRLQFQKSSIFFSKRNKLSESFVWLFLFLFTVHLSLLLHQHFQIFDLRFCAIRPIFKMFIWKATTFLLFTTSPATIHPQSLLTMSSWIKQVSILWTVQQFNYLDKTWMFVRLS
jgi:hypothetical protein